MKTRHWIGAAAAALSLAGASGCRTPFTACTLELRVEVSPAEKTIRVGESFQARAEGVSCGGRDRSPYAVDWRTADTGVVSVDATTGRVTGLAPGTATVTAHEPTVSADWSLGSVRVTVQP
jgi:uncharacterized protein YjdB